jgi:hypothetical protein
VKESETETWFRTATYNATAEGARRRSPQEQKKEREKMVKRDRMQKAVTFFHGAKMKEENSIAHTHKTKNNAIAVTALLPLCSAFSLSSFLCERVVSLLCDYILGCCWLLVVWCLFSLFFFFWEGWFRQVFPSFFLVFLYAANFLTGMSTEKTATNTRERHEFRNMRK